jgi:hypothetical protein
VTFVVVRISFDSFSSGVCAVCLSPLMIYSPCFSICHRLGFSHVPRFGVLHFLQGSCSLLAVSHRHRLSQWPRLLFGFPLGCIDLVLGCCACERFVIVQERVGLDFSARQLLTLVSVMESSCAPGCFSCFVVPLATKTHVQISPSAGRSLRQRAHA